MPPTSHSELVPDQLSRYCTALKQQLGKSPYWSIRHLVCHIDSDLITVQGTVSSFYLKQIAQTLATKAIGAERLRSEIDVQSD
jgi:hypothetical protein